MVSSTNVTVVGAGSMGAAIAARLVQGGASVQVLARDAGKAAALPGVVPGAIGDPITGGIVVLALPYAAVGEVVARYADQLDGAVLVDLTNPVDFATFDSLVVPAGSSAAAEIAALAPGAAVLKAFNTTFAATLASGTVGAEPTTVLVAGDDADAKAAFTTAVEAGGLRVVDAGSLKRAHELEALGFLQMTLAAAGATSWSAGFALAR
ncbi:NADPH-dependent F420 reductase [Cellulomonas edaphi]|uniref:NAD(P)-binding domain-containing protein n=1 Tax=Cellulomonas edaphi TaxID=3053468 RepID=A0ABT7S7Y1_9CELL|nr:NAD(P)-binding domain-containing protein [Cellulomons edaphi]MDM7831049.1 NAD(P)-binding domain-containing protein [Cellulomons edaphi]